MTLQHAIQQYSGQQSKLAAAVLDAVLGEIRHLGPDYRPSALVDGDQRRAYSAWTAIPLIGEQSWPLADFCLDALGDEAETIFIDYISAQKHLMRRAIKEPSEVGYRVLGDICLNSISVDGEMKVTLGSDIVRPLSVSMEQGVFAAIASLVPALMKNGDRDFVLALCRQLPGKVLKKLVMRNITEAKEFCSSAVTYGVVQILYPMICDAMELMRQDGVLEVTDKHIKRLPDSSAMRAVNMYRPVMDLL
jgi:hypothetical protein